MVAGGGPAGVMLAYLLARAGVAVTLLESRGNFDRRFRGDSIAPPVLDYLDTLGLAEPMLAAIPHGVATSFVWRTPNRSYVLADYRGASDKFPYYALVPQGEFLPFIVEQGTRFAGFRVEMGARAGGLLRDGAGRVVGVEYSQNGQRHRLEADLVVGADGRNSKVRALSGLTATELGANIDLCWYAVPRRADDPVYSGLELVAEPGATLAVLGQADSWQLGYILPAGSFGELTVTGVGSVVATLRRRLPWLGDRLDGLTDARQLALLPVRITAVDRWSEPGLLLLGDAAHVISPVGGNGINLAILDAAEAANRLVHALLDQRVDPARVDAATAMVETVRRPQVDREQAFQVRVERSTAQRLRSGDPRPALPLRIASRVPGLARLLARRSARALAAPAPAPGILESSAPTPR